MTSFNQPDGIIVTYLRYVQSTNNLPTWAVAEAQQSLTKPKIRSSNPVIGKHIDYNYQQTVFNVGTEIKSKEAVNG